MKVWKYNLKGLDALEGTLKLVGEFEIPSPAQPISAAMTSAYQASMWVLVGDNPEKTNGVKVFCIGTGYGEIPDDGDDEEEYEFLTTIQDDAFVWHLFYTVE
ncbi:MAG: DUF7352 domain-containing protein [Candidatus Thorarchaeota archaeon]|nr:hypothetical protein [Thermoplasmatales archaeon]